MATPVDLNGLRDEVVAAVAGALGEGVAVVTDPRAVTPPAVLVGVPVVEVSDVRTARVLVPVHVIATGPGNDDAVRWQLDRMGAILANVRPIVDIRPGPYDTGDRVLPAYTAVVSRTVVYC